MPYSIWDCLWLAPAAVVIDLVLGDPGLPWPHPVCLIGKFLNTLEMLCRKISRGAPWPEKIPGFFAVALTAGCSGIVVYWLVKMPVLGPVMAVYLGWAGLAMGCLLETGKTVIVRVENGDILKAREGVGWLVSRDVSQMERPLLRQTLADTLSENFTDAFVAPCFWLIIGAPVALWVYKAGGLPAQQ